jgi:GR25 family glycosyltransferase involved in LPS biosynthesis
MEGQLASVAAHLKRFGVTMSFARYPALRITSSTLRNSFKEYPTCYPSGLLVPLRHEEDSGPGKSWKGVLGNACSHLKLLEDLSSRAPHSDYYLILEDDVIFDIKRFVHALTSYLELDQGHWSMLAFDTFSFVGHERYNNKTFNFSAPTKDRIDGPLDLYFISGSPAYWGAHAWLVHSARLKQVWEHFRSIPTMPLDWYPKWSSQLHVSFVSYQSRSLWQRRYAPPDQTSEACAYRASSDILDVGNARIAYSSRHSISSHGEVIILGMYNSGTHLFHRMLHYIIEKPLKAELCKNYSDGAYCGRVWKHTHPERLSETISLRPDYGDFNQTTAIVLVRHPFALIHSLQTGENYDVQCGEPNDLLTGKSVLIKQSAYCTYVPPTGTALKSQMGNERIESPICPRGHREKRGPQCWGSVAEGWNSYMGGYLHNLTGLFKHVKIIRYEDLVQDPDRAMQDLTKDQGPRPPSRRESWDWTPYEGESRNLGGNRSDMLQKLTEYNYGANFTKDELKFLCDRLDIHIMGRLGYHGCTPALNDKVRMSISSSQ